MKLTYCPLVYLNNGLSFDVLFFIALV